MSEKKSRFEHKNVNWIEEASEAIDDYICECGGENFVREGLEEIIREKFESSPLYAVAEKMAAMIRPFTEQIESQFTDKDYRDALAAFEAIKREGK